MRFDADWMSRADDRILEHLAERGPDTPKGMADSGRFDVSGDVLRNHYDESSEEGQRRTRAAHFFDGDQSLL